MCMVISEFRGSTDCGKQYSERKVLTLTGIYLLSCKMNVLPPAVMAFIPWDIVFIYYKK